jgi:hypothetical protein
VSDRSREDIMQANPNLRPIAYPLDEGAAELGMSLKSFNRYVRPYVRVIRRGGLVLVLRGDLERWAEDNAETVLAEVEAA